MDRVVTNRNRMISGSSSIVLGSNNNPNLTTQNINLPSTVPLVETTTTQNTNFISSSNAEIINLSKKVYAKNQYEKVIDTKFSQLATTVTPSPTEFNVEDLVSKFFQDYENLFYSIPKTGATNSHEYLIKTSTEYINYVPLNDDLQALIDEINLLQQQNLELNQRIVEIQTSGSQTNG